MSAAAGAQLPAVQHGRIVYVDEVLSQAAQLHGAAVRVLGQCAPVRAALRGARADARRAA
jgi:hypothetical protein